MTREDLIIALEPTRIGVRDGLETSIRAIVGSLREKYGPLSGSGWYQGTRTNWEDARMAKDLQMSGVIHGDDLVEETLRKHCNELATDYVMKWSHKLMVKVGSMENPKLLSLSSWEFEITGEKDGHHVRIEQKVTYNRSRLGRLFYQFPARIYLDGKFIPEKAFKEGSK